MVRQPERHKLSYDDRRDTGVPSYRTHVQYIPQRPSLLPGTPRDLIETMCTFHARLTPERFSGDSLHLHRAMDLAERWGIAKELWDRPWGSLSGGEAQRLSLAIPYGLNCAEVLLLDGVPLPLKPQRRVCSNYCISQNRRPRSIPIAPPWWRERSSRRSRTPGRLSRRSFGSPIPTSRLRVSARGFCTSLPLAFRRRAQVNDEQESGDRAGVLRIMALVRCTPTDVSLDTPNRLHLSSSVEWVWRIVAF